MTHGLTFNEFKSLEVLAPILLENYEQGAIFLVSNLENTVSKYVSKKFDIEALRVGSLLKKNDWFDQCIQLKRPMVFDVPRSEYGVRIKVNVYPIFGDTEENVLKGTFSIIVPSEPIIARAFPYIAPMLAEMFPEGAFIYMTGRKHISHRQASAKFDIPDLTLRSPLQENSIASEVLKTQKPIARELEQSQYGVPILMMSYPIFENTQGKDKITGTFGIALPKLASYKLRDMSNNLYQAMQSIAEVVQHLANSATEVTVNSQKADDGTAQIFTMSNNISEVTGFIKKIADETKMLGLNAAIEAARAGDLGKGFGVVASEIRKLSDESQETVIQIKKLTESINVKVDENMAVSQVLMKSSEEQAAATEELNASVQQILAFAEEIESISRLV
ncbi:MAG: methyl-accepting chemotaxis protein [Bacillota bacterium]|nr:methyl-accepting chemotaxis protein [Bacillota bacterium]